MGKGFEVVTGFVTAPGATLTAWTLAAGVSLQVKNCPFEAPIWLMQMWGDWQTAGVLRVTSPRLHDNVQGIRVTGVASEVKPLMASGVKQRLIPQDTLVVAQSGSATAGDIESGALLVYYENLPGIDGRLITKSDLMKYGGNVVNVENTLALGTAGGFSGEEAINAEYDLLKANTDYALVGYVTNVECAVLGWRGPDTGNLRVAGPGDELEKEITSQWFIWLSEMYGLPCIPVINSANKASTLIDGVQDENGTDVTVNSILVELSPAANQLFARR